MTHEYALGHQSSFPTLNFLSRGDLSKLWMQEIQISGWSICINNITKYFIFLVFFFKNHFGSFIQLLVPFLHSTGTSSVKDFLAFHQPFTDVNNSLVPQRRVLSTRAERLSVHRPCLAHRASSIETWATLH